MAGFVITELNFDEEVVKSALPVLLDFWAPWCGPCKMISPIIDELSKEYEGKVKIGKVNTDENLNLTSKLQISSIPTLLFYKDGKPVQRIVGYRSKEDIKKMIDTIK